MARILQAPAVAAALVALAGQAALAASGPTVPLQLAPFLPTDPAGSSTGTSACAAQNVLDACLVQQGQVFAMCSYSDWECKCQAQRSVAGCFNNCPSDGRRSAHDGQVIVFCNAAKRTQEDEERRSASARQLARPTAPASVQATQAALPAQPAPGNGNGDNGGQPQRPAGDADRSAAAPAGASPLLVADGAAARHGPLLGLGLGLAAWMAI